MIINNWENGERERKTLLIDMPYESINIRMHFAWSGIEYEERWCVQTRRAETAWKNGGAADWMKWYFLTDMPSHYCVCAYEYVWGELVDLFTTRAFIDVCVFIRCNHVIFNLKTTYMNRHQQQHTWNMCCRLNFYLYTTHRIYNTSERVHIEWLYSVFIYLSIYEYIYKTVGASGPDLSRGEWDEGFKAPRSGGPRMTAKPLFFRSSIEGDGTREHPQGPVNLLPGPGTHRINLPCFYFKMRYLNCSKHIWLSESLIMLFARIT